MYCGVVGFQTVLESKREALTSLLVQLVGEQHKREDELMKRLVSSSFNMTFLFHSHQMRMIMMMMMMKSEMRFTFWERVMYQVTTVRCIFYRLRWSTKEKLISRIIGWYSIRGYWRVNLLLCLKRYVSSALLLESVRDQADTLWVGCLPFSPIFQQLWFGVISNRFFDSPKWKTVETTALLSASLFEVAFFSEIIQ